MKTLLLTLAALLIANSSWATIATWTIDAGGNGHTYEVVAVEYGIDWDSAARIAKGRGGYLATITSKEENDFIISLIRQPEYWVNYDNGWWDGPWIGGFQTPREPRADAGWQWVTGEAFAFTDWHPGQPDDVHNMNQDRLHFWDTGSHLTINTIRPQWDDAYGFSFSSIRAYVIEYSAVPEPSTGMLLALAAALGLGIFVVSQRRKTSRPAPSDASAAP